MTTDGKYSVRVAVGVVRAIASLRSGAAAARSMQSIAYKTPTGVTIDSALQNLWINDASTWVVRNARKTNYRWLRPALAKTPNNLGMCSDETLQSSAVRSKFTRKAST